MKTATAKTSSSPASSRRELVRIEEVKDTERPLHVYSAASGELIAKLKAGTDIDHFLSILSDEAFN